MNRRAFACALALVAGFTIAAPVHAASAYPERVITLVVPFGAGGTNDIIGRIIAEPLSRRLGQTVIIDNRAGAGGRVGTLHVARQAPDGYTLTMASSGTNAIGPIVHPDIGYDPLKDFSYITLVAETPYVLAVIKNSGFQSVGDVIKAAKQKPGALNYGSAGVGSATHLAAELFLDLAGVKMEHIPYKGSGPSTTAMLAKEIDVLFASFPGVIGQIKAGQARLLGVGSVRRAPQVPDVPTMQELGLKGYEATLWITIAAPAKTPNAIIGRLHAELRDIIENDKGVRQRLVDNGAAPLTSKSPDEILPMVRATMDRWRPIIQRTVAAK
jgi:tripartite-type tricarboxylate transporter receptor subunit TctC